MPPTSDKPTCFICYTVKGFGLPMAGHKDNHAGLMTPAQMEVFRQAMAVRPGHEWDKFEGLTLPAEKLQKFLDRVPFAAGAARRLDAPAIDVPETLPVTIQPTMATQTGFGALLNEIGRGDSGFAQRIVTTSPDVTVSTNLGPWVNRRGLFAREAMADTFKSERIPSTFNWEFSPKGQHIELGIAENNLFILLSALGLSHSINGERLLPIGTLYDPFIARGLDALNYACYQDARFILVATPSGITLAGEGGAHQSIAEPLIGLAQDGLAAFEPAYVDELAVILRWAFAYIQKDGDAAPSERNWLRDETGGSVYLRLSTRPIEQIERKMTPELAQQIVDGAYWLRKPGPNAQVMVAYQRRGGAGSDRRRRPDGGGPPRRRPARRHLGRPAQRRLERGAARARARPRPCALAYRAAVGGGAAALRHRQRARRPPGDTRLARRGRRPPHARARRRAFRPDRLVRRSLSALRHRHQRHRRGRAGDRARPADQAPEGTAVITFGSSRRCRTTRR